MPRRPPPPHSAPDHDAYFQENFADPQSAASLVRLAAPPELLAVLELDKLTPLPTTQFDPDLGKRIPDLLFECPSQGGKVVVSILFEHKSHPDYRIALQLLRYMLLDHERRQRECAKQPALVLPILVYHGRRTWKPNLGLVHERHVPEPLRPYILHVPALFVDLSCYEDETLETFAGLDDHTRATLLAMKHIFELDENILGFLMRLALRIQAMPTAIQQRFLERTILYLMYSGGVKAKDAQTLLELTPDGEDAMRFKTGYQKDMEESYQNGEAKGLELGLEQGLEQGLERGLSLLDEKNLEVVRNMLARSFDWETITAITHIDPVAFAALEAKYRK